MIAVSGALVNYEEANYSSSRLVMSFTLQLHFASSRFVLIATHSAVTNCLFDSTANTEPAKISGLHDNCLYQVGKQTLNFHKFITVQLSLGSRKKRTFNAFSHNNLLINDVDE